MKAKSRRIVTGALAACMILASGGSDSLAAANTVLPLKDMVTVKEGQALSGFDAGEGISRSLELLSRKQEEIRQQEEAAQEAAVSGSDTDLLAALIYCEAGGEPYEGQVAVGAVVMNRVKSGSFPNSISEVIYQSGQFGPAITGKLDRVLAAGSATESCYQAAREALAGASPVGDALYFGDGQNYGIQIGGHWFHT